MPADRKGSHGRLKPRKAPRPATSRPRRDRETPENEILEAAFAEFAAHGYMATRLEDVARRAGIAKGLPSFYFDSKEELFKAVLHRHVLPDWSVLEAQLGRTDLPTMELLRGLVTVAYERLVKNARAHRLLRLLIAEGPKFPELAEFHHAELIQRAIALLGRLLARRASSAARSDREVAGALGWTPDASLGIEACHDRHGEAHGSRRRGRSRRTRRYRASRDWRRRPRPWRQSVRPYLDGGSPPAARNHDLHVQDAPMLSWGRIRPAKRDSLG